MFLSSSHIYSVKSTSESLDKTEYLTKYIAGATDGKKSQLERLVFSENFVKEESEVERTYLSREKYETICYI